MVEVFRTNITNHHEAKLILDAIHKNFTDHLFNFDLEDCDKILRAETQNISLDACGIMNLVTRMGFTITILPDEILT